MCGVCTIEKHDSFSKHKSYRYSSLFIGRDYNYMQIQREYNDNQR